ncbi:aminotransferase class III-fold pyridoxal phosphate-dependent enzyme [Novosphingobium pokkalii]|uniref:aminotransferase class III-fold pyridoxal phosphate-dependent enzyme n=1 Tax=Novosphingobium pokkalii TaxID=1770194 RepID=UPI00362A939A
MGPARRLAPAAIGAGPDLASHHGRWTRRDRQTVSPRRGSGHGGFSDRRAGPYRAGRSRAARAAHGGDTRRGIAQHDPGRRRHGPYPAPPDLCGWRHRAGRVCRLRRSGRAAAGDRRVRGAAEPGAARLFHPHAGSNRHDWDLARVTALAPALPRIADNALRAQCAQVLAEADARIYPALARTRHQVVHQDAHMGNLLVDPAEPTRVVGVIDFGDMLHGPLLADLATAADCFPDAQADPLAILADVTQGFDAVCPLEEAEIDLVFDLCCLRLVNTVLVAAARHDPADTAPDLHLGGGHKHGAMLGKLLAVGRTEATRMLRRACGFPVPALMPDPAATQAALIAQREAAMGKVWHFYQSPLHLTRGEGAWLIGADGARYLDAYNNVPQVGHSHPAVVRAIARQAAALNANTRYLADSTGAYAQALLAQAPAGFDVCAFVNSGSEANDLAAQIARFATGRHGAVVMEGPITGSRRPPWNCHR